MGSPHTILPRLKEADHTIPDPGTGKAIGVDRDMGLLELTIAAGVAETNTLAAPAASQAGLRLNINVRSFGAGGSRAVTCTGGFKTTAGATQNQCTFNAATSFIALMAMNMNGTMFWVSQGGTVVPAA